MGRAVATLQPGEERPFGVNGNYLQVIQSSELLSIELIQRGEAYEEHLLKQGGALYDKKFSSIIVKNEGASASAVVISTGIGKFQPSQNDARVSVDTTQGPVSVELDENQLNVSFNHQYISNTINNPGDATAGATASLLIGANANRKVVKFSLPSTAVAPVRIGNASVTASSGDLLEPGMSVSYTDESAWYVIRTGLVDETVTVLELERS